MVAALFVVDLDDGQVTPIGGSLLPELPAGPGTALARGLAKEYSKLRLAAQRSVLAADIPPIHSRPLCVQDRTPYPSAHSQPRFRPSSSANEPAGALPQAIAPATGPAGRD